MQRDSFHLGLLSLAESGDGKTDSKVASARSEFVPKQS